MSDVPEELPALHWLSLQFPDSPKKRLKEWFALGRVRLDGKVITKPHERMTDPGERLTLCDKSTVFARVFFSEMPKRIHVNLNLLYIDEHLAIVTKAAGLLSVPLPEGDKPSALSILDSYLQGQGSAELDRNRINRQRLTPLPVHRLDQYTSGLLCLAMNPEAREHLVEQVRSHSFIREYLALGDGKLAAPQGEWRSWFRLNESGLHQTVFDKPTEGANVAVSSYEVLDEFTWPTKDNKTHTVSRLRLRLETGLRHQLRIHAARAGVPLLGDRTYNPDFKRAAETKSSPPHGCTRQALHASSIGFIHPHTGKSLRFNSPLPEELTRVEAGLRDKAAGK